ncbi:helix-turn-helix domain-containing protein [Streptomyces sp. S1A]|uniref:helix-turn-helix domain-containing protein n=1 Tax=Streptomyces sp. ICN903 TaxID=2964654 RepID=UPI001EDA4B33|nr:helix-turn-helix transcriptional regulator [Streptomyces sp. ICN903]MCG3039175.1 helix-turn-helix domain-containing protein [Streptomyces sp. ICN903]
MATGRIELGPTGKMVAANIKRLREAQGLSLRALAKRVEESGRKISADALNKIENGRLVDEPDYQEKPPNIRRVDADDLVVLSVALGVNPSALLLPDTTDGSAHLTGGGSVDAETAWDWADGKRPLRVPEGDDGTALLDFTRWSRPRGRRRRYNLMTPAGRQAALEDPHREHDRSGDG